MSCTRNSATGTNGDLSILHHALTQTVVWPDIFHALSPGRTLLTLAYYTFSYRLPLFPFAPINNYHLFFKKKKIKLQETSTSITMITSLIVSRHDKFDEMDSNLNSTKMQRRKCNEETTGLNDAPLSMVVGFEYDFFYFALIFGTRIFVFVFAQVTVSLYTGN
jgi:hypothetical protein